MPRNPDEMEMMMMMMFNGLLLVGGVSRGGHKLRIIILV